MYQPVFTFPPRKVWDYANQLLWKIGSLSEWCIEWKFKVVFTLLKFPRNWCVHNSAIQANADKPRFNTCTPWECMFAQFHSCPLYSQKQVCAINANKRAGREGSVQLLVFLRLSPDQRVRLWTQLHLNWISANCTWGIFFSSNNS